MKITYLGHAGFLVETANFVVVIDPWLSPNGAFDSGWFQFPCNHHLLELLNTKLSIPNIEKYIYISHEHKDHFDIWTLKKLNTEDCSFLIPEFRRPVLYDLIEQISTKKVELCPSDTRIDILGGYIKIYAEDSELNRDSAILVATEAKRFLNINDCKLHDRLAKICMEEGKIDVFAAQYSGATWHPVCYDYPEKTYQRISRKKMFSKFEATARAIETVQPKMYLPSAGPPCFLDPALIHINFEPVNIFPRTAQLAAYLEQRLNNKALKVPDMMPGDSLNVDDLSWKKVSKDRVNEDNFEDYVKAYANRYSAYFKARHKTYTRDKIDKIQERLIGELTRKLKQFSLSEQIDRPFYLQFKDHENSIIKVDFQQKTVSAVSGIAEGDHYKMSATSYELERVLDGHLTWEDFSLTFRMSLNREPDVYQTIMQGFLILEAEDLEPFCSHILALENNQERIIVEAGGCRYSVDKLCPHQGADLSQGWIEEDRYLVCPRHRWRFDLYNDGVCIDNAGTVNCVPLEED